MDRLDFVEIGRSGKYFNATKRTVLDNLFMFDGYKANFLKLENGYFLRIDPAKKIVRTETAMDVINNVYRLHKDKEKE